eukprot:10063023-Alexandrium_andersonii.AAC.1
MRLDNWRHGQPRPCCNHDAACVASMASGSIRGMLFRNSSRVVGGPSCQLQAGLDINKLLCKQMGLGNDPYGLRAVSKI